LRPSSTISSTELTTTQKVSDETYARTKKVFNDQQIGI